MAVLKNHRLAMVQPRTTWTKTLVLWGDTGIGKSTRAHWEGKQNMGKVATMLLPRSNKDMVWGDGCIAAKTIIIEDIGSPGEIAYSVLKNMLDWTPMIMPVKGMHMQWAPTHVIITSNHDPSTWYAQQDGAWNAKDNALFRRLTTNGSRIVNMTKEWHVPGSPMDLKPPGDDANATA